MLDNLIDAQAMAQQHPALRAPSLSELARVASCDVVKVCRNRERFWVLVTEVEGQVVTGTVNNRLVWNDDLTEDQTVQFEKRHIFAVMSADEVREAARVIASVRSSPASPPF
jgi:hypothetical protein